MKYIFRLVLMLLLSGVIHAEQDFIAVKPVPAPTTPRIVMVVEQNESLSSKNSKKDLKDLAAELNLDNNLSATIFFYEKRARSTEGLRTANQIKNYLTKKAGIKSDLITLVKSGNSINFKIQIYLMPQTV